MGLDVAPQVNPVEQADNTKADNTMGPRSACAMMAAGGLVAFSLMTFTGCIHDTGEAPGVAAKRAAYHAGFDFLERNAREIARDAKDMARGPGWFGAANFVSEAHTMNREIGERLIQMDDTLLSLGHPAESPSGVGYSSGMQPLKISFTTNPAGPGLTATNYYDLMYRLSGLADVLARGFDIAKERGAASNLRSQPATLERWHETIVSMGRIVESADSLLSTTPSVTP